MVRVKHGASKSSGSATKNAKTVADKSPSRNQENAPAPPVQKSSNDEDSTYLYLLMGAHIIAATLAPIQDCDEVFNFYEPSHYLNHGFGLQTWELSPEYAIRSWFYALVHSVGIYLGSLFPFQKNKIAEFYICRGLLAAACTTCEGRLYKVIAKTMNNQIAGIFLGISFASAGMFHASVSYLPSSFAMCAVMLGMATCMDREAGSKLAKGLTYFSIGTVIGWPFAAILAVPFVFEELAISWYAGKAAEGLQRLGSGVSRSLIVLGAEIVVDSIFYRKLTCVPLNIILYNVFPSSGRGPEIFGTEPWHFYLRNLLINYNLWFILALAAAPLALLQLRGQSGLSSQMSLFRLLVITSPVYLWLAIFTLQPHKEERFMYPIYPCIAVNAALALYAIHKFISSYDVAMSIRGTPTSLNTVLLGYTMVAAHFIGIWRSAGLTTAYNAPLRIYEPLHHAIPTANATNPSITNVCISKEWYRFPSSYHLPNNARLKFVQSDFRGLLPSAFQEDIPITIKDIKKVKSSDYERYPGTWVTPAGMNDENIEDHRKYTNIDECHFLIDTYLPSQQPSTLQPNYVNDTNTWEQVKCLPYLDAAATPLLGRLFWFPEHELMPFSVPEQFKRQWGEYCLLQRKA